MKTLVVAAIGLAVAVLATPAAAYVVEVTTSIPTATIQDHSQLKAAVESAIDDVLKHAIAFAPTTVTVQDARVAGDMFFFLLLIPAESAPFTMKTLSPD